MLIDNQLTDVNASEKNNFNITPLHWAPRGSGSLRPEINSRNQIYINIAKMLIENGANISAIDDFKRTPLHEAARVGILNINSKTK